jgi:hypothetical protein
MSEPQRGDPERPPQPRRRATGGGRGSDPRTAGFLLLAAIVLCGAVGLGIGTLVGLTAALTIVGLCAGAALGFAIVYSRFKDI